MALWWLLQTSIESANLFAQLLLLGQLILYFTGTQIHKDYFHDIDGNRQEFRSKSLIEGLILMPLAVLAAASLGLVSISIFAYAMLITPWKTD